MHRLFALSFVLLIGGLAPARAEPAAPAAVAGGTESVQQALCRLIEHSARSRQLPTEFLTRLIWAESSFRPRVISPAGAQGIAQFMPQTASERGLADPFDPEQAVPKAAEFLKDLVDRFGNLGLAAAAYNGGPARVSDWLERRGGLPDETRRFVFRVTGRPADDWAADRERAGEPEPGKGEPGRSCMEIAALLRRPADDGMEAPFAPWGVQLAGNFSKERALASYARARQNYAAIVGDVRPMVIGTRLRSRGTRAFYRVRVPAASRQTATNLCERIRAVGGSCVVLPS
jgi:hypothetical protein